MTDTLALTSIALGKPVISSAEDAVFKALGVE